MQHSPTNKRASGATSSTLRPAARGQELWDRGSSSGQSNSRGRRGGGRRREEGGGVGVAAERMEVYTRKGEWTAKMD